jgi:cytochrome c-type biogenesis protein CcmH/NrfF
MIWLAHIGHHLWVLYVIPILFVAIGIVRTMLLERRRKRDGGD